MPVASSADLDQPVLRARGIGLAHTGDRQGVLRRRGPDLRAIAGLDLEINSGAIVWLVGELWSATSAAAVLAGAQAPTDGTLEFSGTDVTSPGRKQRALLQAQVACLLPGALGELAGKRTAVQVVADAGPGAPEPLEARTAAAEQLLASVGLREQRHDVPIRGLTEVERWQVRIARLAAQRPRLVVRVADDPQLPGEVRAALADVLSDLRAEHGTAQVVVAELIPVSLVPPARAIVLCGGQVVEVLGTGDLDHPLHPFSRTLLAVDREAGAEDGVAPDAELGRVDAVGSVEAGLGRVDAVGSVEAGLGRVDAVGSVEAGEGAVGRLEGGGHSPGGAPGGGDPAGQVEPGGSQRGGDRLEPAGVADAGCPYRRSCPRAKARCDEMPTLARPLGASHPVACHFPEDPRRSALRPGPAPANAGNGDSSHGHPSHPDSAPPDSEYGGSVHGGSGEPTAHEFAEG